MTEIIYVPAFTNDEITQIGNIWKKNGALMEKMARSCAILMTMEEVESARDKEIVAKTVKAYNNIGVEIMKQKKIAEVL